jgi:Domain of unknown function (DUF932)
MAQLAKQSDQFNFNVETVPSYMTLPDGSQKNTGFLVNRRTDNFAVLGSVTDRYGLVQNSDLISVVEDAFAAKGLTGYSRKIIVAGEGERMYAAYDFKNHVKKLKVGDEVGMRLTAQNSFDGGLLLSFALGSLRLICSNGMTTLERAVGMTKKHSTNISTKFVAEALEKAVITWDKSIQVFDRLADVAITQTQGANILAQLEESAVLSGKLRENIEAVWNAPRYREDNARNLFNLYNAVTQHLTHDVATTRFELANRVSGNVLGVFERASRDTNRFAKLVQPVAVPLAAVALN